MTQTEWLDALLDSVGSDLSRSDIPRIKQSAIAIDDEHYHMLAEHAVGETLVNRLKSRQRARIRSVRGEARAGRSGEQSLPGIDLSAYDMPAERLMRETLRLHDGTVIEAYSAGPDAEAAMRQWSAENTPGAKTTLSRCRLVRDTADVMTLRREALGRDVSAAEGLGLDRGAGRMTTAPVDTDLACAAADLQHAVHLVGVANRCGDDPARADVLAEARTLIDCASERLFDLDYGVDDGGPDPDPEPEPGVATITAGDLRIGDRLHAHDGLWVVQGIKRYHHAGDVEVMFGVEDETLVGVRHTRTWSDTWRVYVLTPPPRRRRVRAGGGDVVTALAYWLLAYALLGGIVAPVVGHLLRRAGRDLDGWSR